VARVFAWLRLLLRREVVINLHDGTGFQGVLYRKAGHLVELRNAERLEPGRNPVTCDGAVIIERREIQFWQVIRP
jgi:small nuclear ribonucleoprotein (snRNP)-like protein